MTAITPKKWHFLLIVAEVLVFGLTVGAAAYFGQKNQWWRFTEAVSIATIIYALLLYGKSEPILSRLQSLEHVQFQLAERFSEYGLEDFYNIQNPVEQDSRNEETRGVIDRGHVFSLLSLTGTSYIDPALKRHWDHLKQKLGAGSQFRVLLLDPFGPEAEVRDRLNGVLTRQDSKLRLDLLVDLHNRYPNIAIRFSRANIYCALFFSETEMVYDPYHLGKVEDRIENYFMAFKMRDNPDARHSYYRILAQHFENLWVASDSLEVFLRKHEQQLTGAAVSKMVVKPRFES
jgi:hypothetical protein